MRHIFFNTKQFIFKFIRKIWSQIRYLYVYLRTNHLSFEVPELLFQQNRTNGFMRYDMIVRLIAIENYYGKNDYGFGLYYKMQKARKGKSWANNSIDVFKKLINSYEEKGYDESSEITLDANLHLIDGSHRMALALYRHESLIRAKVLPYAQDVFYAIEWFIINGFSAEECRLLENRLNMLKEEYLDSFVCTLWHPARVYFDDITKHLSLFGSVKEVKDFRLNKWDYQFFTRGIYAVDDIEKWKIEKKLEHMLSDNTDTYELRMVSIEMEDPEFRLKENKKTLSKKGETIKQLIRRAYNDKIDNYFHDIIIHIGDNFYQNKSIYNLLNMPKINIKSILEHIRDCQYVITKMDVPYMPKDFPNHYPLGKDIDIICAGGKEYEKVLVSVMNDIKIYESTYHVRTIKYKDDYHHEYRTLVRLEQEGQMLVFQFDIAYLTGRLSQQFSQEMVSTREDADFYYVPKLKYEIVVRLQELLEHPNKSHHMDFLRFHKADIDSALCDYYIKKDWRKLIN